MIDPKFQEFWLYYPQQFQETIWDQVDNNQDFGGSSFCGFNWRPVDNVERWIHLVRGITLTLAWKLEIAHNLHTVSQSPVVWKLPVVWNHTLSLWYSPIVSATPFIRKKAVRIFPQIARTEIVQPTSLLSSRIYHYRKSPYAEFSLTISFHSDTYPFIHNSPFSGNSSLFDTVPSARFILSGIHPSPDQFVNQKQSFLSFVLWKYCLSGRTPSQIDLRSDLSNYRPPEIATRVVLRLHQLWTTLNWITTRSVFYPFDWQPW